MESNSSEHFKNVMYTVLFCYVFYITLRMVTLQYKSLIALQHVVKDIMVE